MKYGLIGCGRIAINHIIAAEYNGLNIVAVCDIREQAIDELFKRKVPKGISDISRYLDYKLMIDENPDLDFVAIATPSGKHAEIALYCISKHINVLIEKPIAMSIEDADKIIESAEKNNVLVSVCHQNRFNIAVQETRKAIETGRFGKISHANINIRWNRDRNYYKQAKWRGTWRNDGGCLLNQCIHGIDLLCWLMNGEIDSVYGVIRRQFHDYIEAEDVGIALLSFDNGAVATIEGTTNVFPQNLEESLYIFGENGTVKLGGVAANEIAIWKFKDNDGNDNLLAGFAENTKDVYGNGHVKLYADMISAIKNNRKPYVDGQAGKRALEVVLAIYKCSTQNMIGTFD